MEQAVLRRPPSRCALLRSTPSSITWFGVLFLRPQIPSLSGRAARASYPPSHGESEATPIHLTGSPAQTPSPPLPLLRQSRSTHAPEANLGATAPSREAAKRRPSKSRVRPNVLPIPMLDFRYSLNTQCISASPSLLFRTRRGTNESPLDATEVQGTGRAQAVVNELTS